LLPGQFYKQSELVGDKNKQSELVSDENKQSELIRDENKLSGLVRTNGKFWLRFHLSSSQAKNEEISGGIDEYENAKDQV
jgi:hypothetical protein